MHGSSNCGVRWGRTDMAKRGIKNPSWLAIAREGAFYSDDDIKAIIAATGSDIPPGRRDELVRRLEQAAELWIFDNAMQRSPTPRKLEKQFSAIERAATRLMEAIGTGPQGALNPIPGPILDRLQMAAAKKATRLGKSGRTLLRESVTGVVQIKRWSAKQVQIEIEREAKRKDDSRVTNPRKTDAASSAVTALEELQEMQSEFEDWKEGLPDNLRESAVAEKLDSITEIDFDSAIETVHEAEDADLPLGFGRD